MGKKEPLVFPGNADTSSVVTNSLPFPVVATSVRLVLRAPEEVNVGGRGARRSAAASRTTVCLRMELLGCPFRGNETHRIRTSKTQTLVFLQKSFQYFPFLIF